MAAFLHDGGTFAIVFPNDDQRTACHPTGCQIGQRVRRDIGANGGFEGNRAANGIMDRRRKHCRSGGFSRIRFIPDAQFPQDFLRVGQNVHQVRNRRALITTNIADTGFQQRLGDCQNAFPPKFLASTDLQLLDFFLE